MRFIRSIKKTLFCVFLFVCFLGGVWFYHDFEPTENVIEGVITEIYSDDYLQIITDDNKVYDLSLNSTTIVYCEGIKADIYVFQIGQRIKIYYIDGIKETAPLVVTGIVEIKILTE